MTDVTDEDYETLIFGIGINMVRAMRQETRTRLRRAMLKTPIQVRRRP